MANKSYDEFGPAVEDYSSFGEAVQDAPVKEFGVGDSAKSFMEGFNDPKSMGGGVVGGAMKALGDQYSSNKESLLDIIQGKGYLPTSDLGKPFGVDMTKTPVARTSASLLTDIAAGVLGAKAHAGIEGVMARTADKTLLEKFNINLSNKKFVQTIADNADLAIKSAYGGFNKSYEELLGSFGHKMVPRGYKANLSMQASELLDTTSRLDPSYGFLEKKLSPIIRGENLTANDLQSAKAFVAKHDIGGKLNKAINDILSSKGMGGDRYKSLTSEYDKFINQEAPYVEKMIYDGVGNKNFGKGNLTSEKLLTGNSNSFIRTPVNLNQNTRAAFKSLVGRPSTETDMLSQLDALRKGTIIKRVVGGALVTGASMIMPGTRKVASTVGSLLG